MMQFVALTHMYKLMTRTHCQMAPVLYQMQVLTGPYNSAIGANFEEVYRHMRFDEKILFATSNNPCQFNGVFLHLNTDKRKNKIVPITILPE
nr:hypothetical protein [Mycoplasmopsis bovis]